MDTVEGLGPIYHGGYDTIDAFCKSALRKHSNKELDKTYDDYLAKMDIPSDRVNKDEKDDGIEQMKK